MKCLVQVWWGDGWSRGTDCATVSEANRIASELKLGGYKVRIVQAEEMPPKNYGASSDADWDAE